MVATHRVRGLFADARTVHAEVLERLMEGDVSRFSRS